MVTELDIRSQKLEQEKARLLATPDIDKEILEYLALINTFPGVETGVSCAGHPKEECKGRKGALTTPYVQLFFRDLEKGARFITQLYKQGPPIFLIVASHQIGWVTIHPVDAPLSLPKIRKELFGRILAALVAIDEKLK
ncbi:hypothetical protein ES703_29519 [subsurface metagenome]